MTNIDQETIQFELHLNSIFWDKPPSAQILVDGVEKFNNILFDSGVNVITFTHTLEFNKQHCLSIVRGNKTVDQTKWDESTQTYIDQQLVIEKVLIDGINVRNIVFSQSWSEPIYPEPWATMQKKQGIVLEEKVLGETCLGHNSTWKLNFTSPVYKFLINCVNPGENI